MQSAKARGVNVFRRTGRRRSGAQANLCPAPTEYDGHMTRIIAASTFIADAASSAAKAGWAVVTVLTAAMLPILFNQQRRCYRLRKLGHLLNDPISLSSSSRAGFRRGGVIAAISAMQIDDHRQRERVC